MTLPSLEQLATRIGQAAELVATLRERNAELERRVRELEAELAGREAAAPAEPPPAAAGSGWEREREALRRRVARLADRLEALLEA